MRASFSPGTLLMYALVLGHRTGKQYAPPDSEDGDSRYCPAYSSDKACNPCLCLVYFTYYMYSIISISLLLFKYKKSGRITKMRTDYIVLPTNQYLEVIISIEHLILYI